MNEVTEVRSNRKGEQACSCGNEWCAAIALCSEGGFWFFLARQKRTIKLFF